jgi:Tol biopolymer transport system component
VTSGCGLQRISRGDLPQALVAIHYRTPEQARLHAEAREAAAQIGARRGRGSREVRVGAGVAHTDDLGALLGGVLGAAPETEQSQSGRLGLLDPRTGDVTVVGAALRGSFPLAWSADRQRLLFAQPGAADVQLWEYRRGSETVRPVTRGPLAHTQGCYGPDGRIVAVAVDVRAKPRRSWVAVSAEGGRSPFTPISEGPNDHSPACSQRGAVAYVRETESGRPRVWLAKLATPSASRLLASGRQPQFSPAGDWIVFVAPLQGMGRVWRMRPDGTARAPIGRSVREESSPAVSPDGRFVAFVAAEQAFRRQLYLRRFDGSGDRILFADGDADYPVW